jgi:hypothetical protein
MGNQENAIIEMSIIVNVELELVLNLFPMGLGVHDVKIFNVKTIQLEYTMRATQNIHWIRSKTSMGMHYRVDGLDRAMDQLGLIQMTVLNGLDVAME